MSHLLTAVRRLLRFRLRTLLLAMLAISVALGVYVNRARRQQAAITAIKKFGGEAVYDYQFKNDWSVPDADSWAPAWLRKRLSDDFFHSIKEVTVNGPADFQESQRIEVEVTDELLRNLDGLPWLEYLFVNDIPVSDDGVSHIGKLRCLRVLVIETNVTDAGVAHLAGCRQLEALHLRGGSQLGEEGLGAISQLPRLKTLYLSEHQFTDRGLAHVGQMRQLTTLRLHYSNITDDGLAHLANLTELESLGLLGCSQVTTAGLWHLRGLKNLRSLDLQGTLVTDASKLGAALPDCVIDSNQSSP